MVKFKKRCHEAYKINEDGDNSLGTVLHILKSGWGLYTVDLYLLKGPKHEIFVVGIFTQIRPEWVGDLGTIPKPK